MEPAFEIIAITVPDEQMHTETNGARHERSYTGKHHLADSGRQRCSLVAGNYQLTDSGGWGTRSVAVAVAGGQQLTDSGESDCSSVAGSHQLTYSGWQDCSAVV